MNRSISWGAAIFARGEGVFFGKGELYFTCTSGGVAECGQVMRYVPSAAEGQAGEADQPGRLQLFVESGERDNIFPVKASVASVGHVRDIYRVFGAENRIEQEVFPDEHAFWGRRGLPFLARHLTTSA